MLDRKAIERSALVKKIKKITFILKT